MPNDHDQHTNAHSPRDPTSGDTRVQRLEEHAAFTEHTVEQLSGEIADLNKRMAELLKRLQSLEGRLGKALDALGDDADGSASS